MPDIHRLLAQTCTKGVEEAKRIEGSLDSREENKEELQVIDTLHNIVKEALWALANLAAGPPYVLDSILRDQTLNEIIRIAQAAPNKEIFSEAMFTLANLCTSSSKSQFQQRLLNRDLIVLIIKLIQ